MTFTARHAYTCEWGFRKSNRQHKDCRHTYIAYSKHSRQVHVSDVMHGKRECGVRGVDIAEGRRGQIYRNMKRLQCRHIVVLCQRSRIIARLGR